MRVQLLGKESLGQARFFPSRCVNGQVRLSALTPFVPLSREAGEGERTAPLSHAVGEGLGVRAKKTKGLYPYPLWQRGWG